MTNSQALLVVQDVTAGGVVFLSFAIVLTILAHKDLVGCPRNLLLMSLAVSDLLTGSLYFAFYVVNFREVSSYLLLMVFIARVFNTAALIYDSCIVISDPFRYVSVMARRCRIIIPFCWVLAVIITLPSLLYRNDPNTGLKRKVSLSFLLLFGIIIPYSCFCIALFSIFRQIRRQRRRVVRLAARSGRGRRLDRLLTKKRRVIRCAVITLILALTGFPLLYMTVVAIPFGEPTSFTPPILSSVSNLFILVGSLVNPLIYGFMNPDIQDAVRHRLEGVPIRRVFSLFRSSQVAPAVANHETPAVINSSN